MFCICLCCEDLQCVLYLVVLGVFAVCFVFVCVGSICSVFCIWLCCEDLQCVLYLFVL